MDVLYPNLHERFKSEGLCPICLMEMELAPRYSCDNGHTLCHRCKPYYYACPTCRSPLELIPPPQAAPYEPPPPTHFMPHPLPPQYHSQPSAPTMDDFLHHERGTWHPPSPSEDQELSSCSYAHLGCWVKIPEYLKDLHESRCQFRPHLEDEQLPTDLTPRNEDVVECFYRVVGCNVKTSPWRMSIHQDYCIYKDKYEAMHNITEGLGTVTITDDEPEDGDPEEFVECKYRKYGCMVNMRRRRKRIHESKCNYSKYHREEDEESDDPPSDNDYDPEEQVPCRWAEQGCRVNPKRHRKDAHEEKCNYRMEECAFKYNGCYAMFPPSRKYAHERTCEFAN